MAEKAATIGIINIGEMGVGLARLLKASGFHVVTSSGTR